MTRVEPNFVRGKDPESELQNAIKDEICNILKIKGFKYLILNNFGLDIAVFIDCV